MRKIVVRVAGGSNPVLTEVEAADERELQELVKDTPDLLPIDEFGMTGPLLVVGRETSLPSGSVDLVAITRGGEIILCEFKTGPSNPDFRSVLAQLIDYASDMWRMSLEEFETSVARRYFESDHCRDARVRGSATLDAAAYASWPDLLPEELTSCKERLGQALANGTFHFIALAQRFTPTMERSMEYLNMSMPSSRFYAVEVVRFSAGEVSAFEARTILKPNDRGPRAVNVSETVFLASLPNDQYRETMRDLMQLWRILGLRFDWGTTGTSLRLPIPERSEPLSVGWIFPGISSWYGLRDFNLGFDPSSASRFPNLSTTLEWYFQRVSTFDGAEPVKTTRLRAYHFGPSAVTQSRKEIGELLAELVQRVSAGS